MTSRAISIIEKNLKKSSDKIKNFIKFPKNLSSVSATGMTGELEKARRYKKEYEAEHG